jgi:hypothetical protein
VTFTPTDTTNYDMATTSVSVTVNKATPTIRAAPTASGITQGQSLAASTLSGGTASVGGTFAWTDASITPAVGTSSQGVTFTPTDTTNYNTATTTASVTVTGGVTGLTCEDAYLGKNPASIAPNGMTYWLNWALGGSDSNSPIMPTLNTDNSGQLTYIVYVHTNDSRLNLTCQASPSLDFDSVSPVSSYVVVSPSDAPAGMQKRVYTINTDTERKFLRLKAPVP